MLFKEFGGVDAFPICVKTKDVDEFVNAVYLISGSFGGISFLFCRLPCRIFQKVLINPAPLSS